MNLAPPSSPGLARSRLGGPLLAGGRTSLCPSSSRWFPGQQLTSPVNTGLDWCWAASDRDAAPFFSLELTFGFGVSVPKHRRSTSHQRASAVEAPPPPSPPPLISTVLRGGRLAAATTASAFRLMTSEVADRHRRHGNKRTK